MSAINECGTLRVHRKQAFYETKKNNITSGLPVLQRVLTLGTRPLSQVSESSAVDLTVSAPI